MSIARVIKAYQTQIDDPLILTAGEYLSATDRFSEYPGWIWCIHNSGKAGWVPSSYLDGKANRVMLLRDYDSTEFSVEPGQQYYVISREVGWLWCEDQQGIKGWIPEDNMEILE